MAKYGALLIVSVFLVAATFQQASALRCWRCSSDASTAAFCDDPFSQDIITEQQRRWSFVDCSYPPGTGSYPFNQQLAQTRAVCKKMKQIKASRTSSTGRSSMTNAFGVVKNITNNNMESSVNDRVVISRSCAWEDVNAQPNSCINAQTPSYIKTEFCETCTTDGCNGASQYGPAALMVLLTALVAKLLAW